jgi:hypothetical protein
VAAWDWLGTDDVSSPPSLPSNRRLKQPTRGGRQGRERVFLTTAAAGYVLRSGGLEPRGHVSHRVRAVPAFRPR